jgi:hypothetical protein
MLFRTLADAEMWAKQNIGSNRPLIMSASLMPFSDGGFVAWDGTEYPPEILSRFDSDKRASKEYPA